MYSSVLRTPTLMYPAGCYDDAEANSSPTISPNCCGGFKLNSSGKLAFAIHVVQPRAEGGCPWYSTLKRLDCSWPDSAHYQKAEILWEWKYRHGIWFTLVKKMRDARLSHISPHGIESREIQISWELTVTCHCGRKGEAVVGPAQLAQSVII